MKIIRRLLSLSVTLVVLLCCGRATEITPRLRATVGKIYGAESASPSDADTLACLRAGNGSSEWNQLTAPVVRDLLDPKLTGEEWVRSTMVVMPQMRAVVMKMVADARLVTDRGLHKTLGALADVHRDLLDAYTLLVFAMGSSEKSTATKLIEELRALGEIKTALGTPIAQRLRDQLGAEEYEKALADAVRQSTGITQSARMTVGDQGKAFYDAFVCATLAEKAGNDDEAERFLRWGLKNGREFLTSIERNRNWDSVGEREKVPSAVILTTKGPSHDFVLGRMFEFAASEAIRTLPKREGGYGEWEEKEREAAKLLLSRRRPAAYAENTLNEAEDQSANADSKVSATAAGFALSGSVASSYRLIPERIGASGLVKGHHIAELEQKAQAGDGSSQYFLGMAYQEGNGVPQDFFEALRWLGKAADREIAKAQHAVGELYESGALGLSNTGESSRWFERAANQGFVQSQKKLAAANQRIGKMEVAARWYQKLAEQGDATSQYELGMMYVRGIGVPRDVALGHHWLNVAGAKGEEAGRKAAVKLESEMTPEQKSESAKMSRDFYQRQGKK
jgi:TPR repeat protein